MPHKYSPRFGLTTQERFWQFVSPEPNTGCWLWTAHTHPSGYGYLSTGTRVPERAHRFSYRTFVADIPAGAFVCHKCDQPSCVNPQHLFLGTPKQNTQDSIRKGRWPGGDCRRTNRARGEQCPFSKLTEKQVADIRTLRASGLIYREIAAQFGISLSAAHAICSGKTWNLAKQQEQANDN